MTTPAAPITRMLVALALAASAAACSPSGGSSATPSPIATATPVAGLTSTAGASPTNQAVAAPTAAVTASPATSTATPVPFPSEGEPPPLAGLSIGGSLGVAGRQGSWCYGYTCADIDAGPAAALPRLALPSAGTTIAVSLPEPHRFVQWRAAYRDAARDGAPETVLGGGGVRPDPDVAPVPGTTPVPVLSSASFGGPPSGSWVLSVSLAFAGNLGDATYFWHVTVP